MTQGQGIFGWCHQGLNGIELMNLLFNNWFYICANNLLYITAIPLNLNVLKSQQSFAENHNLISWNEEQPITNKNEKVLQYCTKDVYMKNFDIS